MVTEADLVEQVNAGDENAYKILLDKNLAALTRYVGRMMGNSAEVEDIVQETFIRLWTQGARYDPAAAKLSTWLHNIAHNLCIDHFRKHNRMVLDNELDRPSDDETLLNELVDVENAALIGKSLMQLPKRQRSAIVMCHYQGMSNKEAAGILDVSVDALESLMARGRRKLRELLASG